MIFIAFATQLCKGTYSCDCESCRDCLPSDIKLTVSGFVEAPPEPKWGLLIGFAVALLAEVGVIAVGVGIYFLVGG